MTRLYTPPSSSKASFRRKPSGFRIAAAAVAFVALVSVAWFLFGGKSTHKKREAGIVSIMPVLPPPPPPPPQPTPPPPEPASQPDQPEFVEETQPDAPPEAAPDEPPPMGSNIQGDGAPDGFGLTGKGGGGLIGGRGTGSGAASRFGAYAGRVQSAVSSALRSHKLTRSARLSLKVRIWVDTRGRVTHATLEGSTGNAATDNALRGEILTAITLPEPPPEGMPMPIVMRINATRP